MAYEEKHEEKERRLAAAEVLRQNRTGLVLTGRIRNGELQLDESTLDEIRTQFPDADVAFIALNSPFDAESQPV
ncbi:MAG: hypothetical protein M3Y77_08705 [Actinomycetota bacterium]|nr:hypothetical protein [Actinomycetota bacterium]MDQ2956324.1 hypothetical protein [Actinomycetota bacterium]